MKITKNKKAIATSLIIDFWSLIIFFLIFIIVYVSIVASGNIEYNVCVEKIKIDKTVQLLNILRTPIEVEGNVMPISEYLALYDYTNLDTDEVRENIEKRLANVKVSSEIFCMSFEFVDKDKIVIAEGGLYKISGCEGSIGGALIGRKYLDGKKVAETNFPSKNQNTITAANFISKDSMTSRIGSWLGALVGGDDPCVRD